MLHQGHQLVWFEDACCRDILRSSGLLRELSLSGRCDLAKTDNPKNAMAGVTNVQITSEIAFRRETIVGGKIDLLNARFIPQMLPGIQPGAYHSGGFEGMAVAITTPKRKAKNGGYSVKTMPTAVRSFSASGSIRTT